MSTPWKDPFEGLEFQPFAIDKVTQTIILLVQATLREMERQNDVELRMYPMREGQDLATQIHQAIEAYDQVRTEILKYYRKELASRPPHPILIKMPAGFQICETCHKSHMFCDCTVEYPGGGNKIL